MRRQSRSPSPGNRRSRSPSHGDRRSRSPSPDGFARTGADDSASLLPAQEVHRALSPAASPDYKVGDSASYLHPGGGRRKRNPAQDKEPHLAYLRVNIMDVLSYDLKTRQATLKLYLDVTWRTTQIPEAMQTSPTRRHAEWDSANPKSHADNDDWERDAESCYRDCPFDFKIGQGTKLSTVVDNVGAGEQKWEDWFEQDPKSDKRFSQMRARTQGQRAGVPEAIGGHWLSYRGLGTVTLTQDIDLTTYPFDTQEIRVTVWTKPGWRLELNTCTEPDDPKQSYASTFNRAKLARSLPGWYFRDKKPNEGEKGWPHEAMEPRRREVDDRARIRAALGVGVLIKRKLNGYLVVFIIPFGVIGALSGLALVLPPDRLGARSSIMGLHSVALVSLMVALKSSSEAGIEIVTPIDKYFALILAFIGIGMAESALVYELGDSYVADDNVFAAGWYIMYALMHPLLWVFHRNYLETFRPFEFDGEGSDDLAGKPKHGFPWMVWNNPRAASKSSLQNTCCGHSRYHDLEANPGPDGLALHPMCCCGRV